ncbi:Uncharacterised protein [Mycobacteroides abscessus subsp. abscessus]|nr:Uncharacterised protein [Mycobacteroides abscessus subsp. abscessus]
MKLTIWFFHFTIGYASEAGNLPCSATASASVEGSDTTYVGERCSMVT